MAKISDNELKKLLERAAKQIVAKQNSSRSSAPSSFQSDGRDIPFRNDEQATMGGAYGSEAAESLNQRNRTSAGVGISTLNESQSAGIAKEYGLQGMADDQFSGLTPSQARKKAQQIREGKLGDISSMTSYSYNPAAISGFKDLNNKMKLELDSISNEPLQTKETKEGSRNAAIDSYSTQLAGLFNTQDEFNAAKSQDPEFQRMLQQFEQSGGSYNDVLARINQPAQVPGANIQSTPDYMGRLGRTPEEQKAYDALVPERQLAQQEVAFEASIPQEYYKYYFGTPEELGFIQRQKKEAEDAIKLIERKEELERENEESRASLLKDKYKFEMQKTSSEIEENRLAAKNYMTGMLAKLGALKTSGEAPKALATIEQKYKQQAQQLKTNYDLVNRDIELDLDESLDNLRINRDSNILKIKEDLSKSEDDIWQEISKLQQSATKRIFDIVNDYQKKFSSQTEKYKKEAKAAADKYIKSMADTISTYDVTGLSEGIFVKRGKTEGVLSPTGEIIPLDLSPTEIKQVEGANLQGEDTIRAFLAYPSAFRGWFIQQVQRGNLDGSASPNQLDEMYQEFKRGEDTEDTPTEDFLSRLEAIANQ